MLSGAKRAPVLLTVAGVVSLLHSLYGSNAIARTRAEAAPPAIAFFYPAPRQISAGQTTSLIWNTSNATSVSIDQGVGSVSPNGSVVVRPSTTTTYTLTATSSSGSASASTTLTVTATTSADLTGTWNGLISGTINCSPAPGTATQMYVVALTLTQSAGALTGNGTLTGKSDSCFSTSPTLSLPVSLNGTVSGSTASGTIQSSVFGTGRFAATLNGITMSLSVTFGVMTVSGLLTHSGPNADLTGTWSGTYTAVLQCSGQPANTSGTLDFNVVQNGATFSGVLAIQIRISSIDCQPTVFIPVPAPLSGTVSGNAFAATALIPLFHPPATTVTGTVSGSTMNILLSGNDGTASGTLTRTSATPPVSTNSGAYSGTYVQTFIPCQTTSHTVNGPAAASVVQAGSALSGTFTVVGTQDGHSNPDRSCTITNEPPRTMTFTATLTGSSFAGILFAGEDSQRVLTGTISGTTLNAQAVPASTEDNEVFTFNLTRTASTAPPPSINFFTATPPAIFPGGPATLSWSAPAASAVIIDNGIGPKPATGSVVVHPPATTTYTLTAVGTTAATASAIVTVLSVAAVNVNALPQAMLQPANTGGATTSYTLTNSGPQTITITLSQSGNFFTQSPSSFTLKPGATQTITIIGTSQPAGSYEGASIPSGTGVPSGLQIPVRLLSATPPAGTVTADPEATRVDVAAAADSSPTGTINFTNHGSATLTGILTSDVPWIIPQSGVVAIAPGATVTLTFTVDRSKRADASALIGSAEGNLTLSFLSGGGATFAKRPLDAPSFTPSVSLVKVIDTVQPSVTTTGIPAIASGEIALFVAGVGHKVGSTGALFVSDVSLFNPIGGRSIDDVKFYYTATTGNASSARTTSLPSVPGQVSVAVADVVKNVFSGTDEVGTLQIRSKDADKLNVAATVLTANNPSGTFGNTIPVFRSDRSVAAGDTLVLAGLRKDGTTHTNLYIQETAGSPAMVQIDFLGTDGSTVSSRSESIDAFRLLQLFNTVPSNAVAAIVTNTSTAGGKIVAYATAVDETNSDTWAIADWSRQYGYFGTSTTIIPVAGSVHGANSTFYRTDLAITNRGTSQATGTLRYISRIGDRIDQQISIGAKQSRIISDVIGTTFGINGDSVGYLMFTPATGSVAISSRTFTTVGSKVGTFGTGVPVIPAFSALTEGAARPIAGLSDATRSAVLAARPGTFRTNFALMETTGSAVKVRVTFRFTFPAGAKVQGIGYASRDYDLNGNAFLLLNSIAGEILGPSRLTFGDLSNVEADFHVISGGGSVVLFTSSVDNATGDSILRTE